MGDICDLLYPLGWSVMFLGIKRFILPLHRPDSLPLKKYEKFDNIAVSTVHSTVTAVASLVSLYYE